KMSCEMHFGREVPDSLSELITSPFASENLATASKIIEVMRLQGWDVSAASEHEGLLEYKAITHQKGRWQFIPESSDSSSILLDCAHNTDGMNVLINSLVHEYPNKVLHVVFGTVADKDPSQVLSLLPKNSVMYWCAADVPRAMDVDALQTHGLENGLSGRCFPSVRDAVSEARKSCFSDDWSKAIVCGSVYVVGDALQHL
ncbi:MAG: hypothetical protein OSA04_05505, partial [Flavobacteriales bacterium]|nr:hypothetical protein [Flavobacteriales bacterium]